MRMMFASDNYDSTEWPHLNNPVDDAKSIAQELRNFYGFHAEVYENQTYSGIKTPFGGRLPEAALQAQR